LTRYRNNNFTTHPDEAGKNGRRGELELRDFFALSVCKECDRCLFGKDLNQREDLKDGSDKVEFSIISLVGIAWVYTSNERGMGST
jgi:hypothetical protein